MSYSKFHMKCVVSLTLAICCATALAASAVENRYQQATILNIEQRATTRVLYYVVDTPITKEDPYYEVSLQLKDAEYEARYTPRHKDDTLPEEWTSGAKVQARVQGRHLFLKASGASELQLVIVKRKPLLSNVVPGTASK